MLGNILRSTCIVVVTLVLLAAACALVVFTGHLAIEQYAQGQFQFSETAFAVLALIAGIALTEAAVKLDRDMGRMCGWRMLRPRKVEKPDTSKPWESSINESDDVPDDVLQDMRQQRT